MDDENVLKLISYGESEQVERKEQLRNKKPEVCQAICAFANDFPRTGRPGVVVIGQRDDGTSRGLPITDAPTLALDGMRPHPRCDLLILLDLDTTTQRERLIARDRRWNTSVAERTEHLASTFAAGMAELPRDPDLVVPATDPIDRNVDAIVRLLEFHRVGVR